MKTVITTLLLAFTQLAFGQNIHSAYIQQTTSGSVMEVDYFVTASLADSNLTTAVLQAKISCLSNTNSVTLSGLTVKSKSQIESNCRPNNTPWLYVFHKTINLSDALYSSISGCCDFRLDALLTQRDTNINTLSSAKGQTMYVYTNVFQCGSLRNNTSVVLNELSLWQPCSNTSAYLNLNGSDVTEFDSISYKLVAPLSDNKTGVTFKTDLYPDNPVRVHQPSQPYPYRNSKSMPPIGFSFDNLTGDFIFTPLVNNQKGAMAIAISEWRKDGSGKYLKVGETHAEVGIDILSCGSNNPPTISGKLNYSVCEGDQLCFNLTTSDKVKVPPPPASTPAPDTVTLKWNRGISGASFTITDPTAIHQSARFCWTPGVGAANSLPYTFVVTARDNFCDNNAMSNRAVSVVVKPRMTGEIQINRISDSSFSASFIAVNNVDPSTISMELTDSTNTVVSNTLVGHFTSSGSSLSTKLKDTVVINKAGRFYLRTIINNTQNCPTVLFDTLTQYTLGLGSLQKLELQLYPNPVKDIVNLPFELESVQLVSISGKIVLDVSNTKLLDVSHLSNGMYFLIGGKDNLHYRAKLLKE